MQDSSRALTSPAQLVAPSTTPRTGPPATAVESGVPSNAEPLAGGEIIARVDGQIVLASDVLWQVNQIIDANRERIPPGQEEEVRRMIMRQQVVGLIDTKLLYADFRRQVPAENLPSIEKNLVQPFEEMEIPRLSKVLQVSSRSELAVKLNSLGTSLDDVQRQFIERTIAGEWLRQRAPKPKPITHEEMLSYYQEHLADFEFEAQATWEELMIRFDRHNNDRAAAWRAITALGNEVWQVATQNPSLRGAVFTDIAKQKSEGFTAADGGLHDWTTKGALRSKVIDEKLFSLQVGQLSNVLESDLGFHIIRVLKRKDAGRTSFAEAQSGIRKRLEAEKKSGMIEKDMLALRKQARVWTTFDGELTGPQLSELLNERRRR